MFKQLISESVKITHSDGEDLTNKCLVLSLANDFEDSKWRSQRFQNFVWNSIAQTALSKRERDALVESPQTLLVQSAKNLRLTDSVGDIGAGSELAEAVLYGVMHKYMGALSVVPKIFYKQNSQDNAKGADSVHITLTGDGDFRIWFGESKFYKSIEDARLASVISSVAESLRSEKLRKENSIICNVSDLADVIADVSLLEKVRSHLSHDVSIDNLKPKLCVPILLLHECELTAKASHWSKEYERSLIEHHRERAISYFKRQIEKIGDSVGLYKEITFHVILFPVPSKEKVVNDFLGAAAFHKGLGE